MPATVRDRLASNAVRRIRGRRAERAVLHDILATGSALVVHLWGAPGIGKSTLLAAFAAEAAAGGASVLSFDCSAIEPTERGLLVEFAEQLSTAPDLVAVATALVGQTSPLLLGFDGYEAFGLLDAWLRGRLLPALPARSLVVLASRFGPAPAWTGSPAWDGLLRSLRLGPLSDADGAALLAAAGVKGEAMVSVLRFAAGHPLALALAAEAARAGMEFPSPPAEVAIPALARHTLADIADRDAREVLRMASVARRITRGLLCALCPAADADLLYDRLAALPVATVGRDGIALHEAVQQALSIDLEAADPELHRRCRAAAWRQVSTAARIAPPAELWRWTADLIHLIRNPVIREAFFPRDAALFAVEPATPADHAEISAIARAHDGAAGVDALATWLHSAPAAFHVARRDGAVAGFYCLLDAASAAASVPPGADPVAARFIADLAASRPGPGESTLFLRRWLGREEGEHPSPVQAACWLDIKRHYMERRPGLRRVYMALADPALYAAAAASLGIAALPGPVRLGTRSMTALLLDMGPGSVDGWLRRLVAAELGIAESGPRLDPARRVLDCGGYAVKLTRREYDVAAWLEARPGTAVSRDTLIAEIWGLRHDPGSNVVDAVVASLRRKLGEHAGTIETARGFGYIWRNGGAAPPPV